MLIIMTVKGAVHNNCNDSNTDDNVDDVDDNGDVENDHNINKYN